jgi:hypothetical protein
MATTGTNRYLGYDIVPMRQWSQWCVGIYPTRADLPILPRSTLSTMAPQKEVVVEEAKQKIDRILARLNIGRTEQPRFAGLQPGAAITKRGPREGCFVLY